MTEYREKRTQAAQCGAKNKRGERCRARAIERGLCAIHSGRVDPATIGAKGGRSSVRSRLGFSDVTVDESLRTKAKRRLEQMLDSDDDALAIRAATSLYSYRSQAPPGEREQKREVAPTTINGHRITSLADVLELHIELGLDDLRLQEVVLRAADHVRELRAANGP